MRNFLTFTTFSLLFCSTAFSDPNVITKEFSLRGTPKTLQVSNLSSGAPKKVILWAKSPGNLTANLELYVSAPEGLEPKAYAAFIRDTTEETLAKKAFHYPIPLRSPNEMTREHSKCLNISIESEADEPVLPKPEDFPPMEHPLCDLLSEEELAEIAATLSEVYGGEWGIGNACAYFISLIDDPTAPDKDELCDSFDPADLALLGIFCPTDSFFARHPAKMPKREISPYQVGQTYYGLLRKDACLTAKNPNYLIMLEFDLQGVTKELFPDGVTFSVRARETKLKKGRQAAIKPVSEGRYSPRPLVMMNWLGDTCGNKISVTKWKKFKPYSIKPLTVYGLLSYKGMVLNLALVDGALSGGKGTAELYTRREAYGVCFDLVRRRQNKNGWPR